LFGCSTYVFAGSDIRLDLQCTINISNYNGVKHASITKNVSLTALKHRLGGAVLVSQTDEYEFWAMIHGVQTTGDSAIVNNYQVAIKDKGTGVFMHALSDTTHNANVRPVSARLSLVSYNKNTFLEEGELIFECVSK